MNYIQEKLDISSDFEENCNFKECLIVSLT